MNPFATRVLLTTSSLLIAGITASAQMLMPSSVPIKTVQDAAKQSRSINSIVPHATSEETAVIVATSPVLRPASTPKVVALPQEDPRGAKVGMTYYDFQTNASMAKRVTYFEDGSDKYLQVIWMAAKDGTRDPVSRAPGFNTSRGSHYNFLDVNDPDSPIPGIEDWKKIESQRAGWPSLVQFDDGSVGTPSHTPIYYFGNAGVGDDQFFEFAQVSQPADSALWPRAAVDGENNVHLIYNRNIPGSGTQVAYRRSTDRGSTWEPEILFTGPSALVPSGFPSNLLSTLTRNGNGGDSYAITARGSNVVVAYSNAGLQIHTRKSTDYGRTWDDAQSGWNIIFAGNYTMIDSTTYSNGDSIELQSDTVASPSAHIALAIDSEGRAHYTVGQTVTYLIQKGATDPSQPRSGIIYEVDDESLFRFAGVYYYKEGDTVFYNVGPAGGGDWDGQGTIVSRRPYSGASRYPSMGVDANDNIYLAYCSVKTGDVLPMQIDTTPTYSQTEPDTLVEVDGLYGHVYLTHKLKNFPQWSAPKDATPSGVNSLFASVCDNVVNDRIYIAYSVSPLPGDRVTNVETDAVPADIYVMAYPTSELNVVSSVGETQELQADVTIAPNPANERTRLHISSVTPGTMSVSVVTMHGERVMRSTSPTAESVWDVEIPTQQLASGAYMIVIEQNGATVTQTLSVIH